MSQKAGSIALRGRLLTMAGHHDATAILIKDGLITKIGSDEVIKEARQDGIEVLELGERVIMPGFIDPHVHFEHLATGTGRAIDCRVPLCKTIEDVLARLSEGLGQGKTVGNWLIGYGNLFFDQKLAERRLPTREELDSVSQLNPIVLHCGGHVATMNSLALEIIGVERFQNGAEGLWGSPVVQLDAQGKPTGVVAEVDGLFPIPASSKADLASYFAQTHRELFLKHGVTTLGEMSGSINGVELLDEMVASCKMPGRVVVYAMVPQLMPLGEACEWAANFRSSAGSDWVRVAGVKIFADGGYSARNAASRSPYVEEHAAYPGYSGTLNLSRRKIIDAIKMTRQYKLQLAVHTNGTRAQDEVLAACRAAGSSYSYGPVRVEHLGNVVANKDVLPTWKDANVTPVMQPGFLHNFIGDYVPMLLGGPGLLGRMPLRSIMSEGIYPAFSSDVGLGAEIGSSNPLFTIWSAVARQSYWGLHIDPTEAVSVAEGLRCHTIEAARALGMDDTVGSLQVGKFGDIAVLDGDPRSVPLDDIASIKVTHTFVAGKLVYEEGE